MASKLPNNFLGTSIPKLYLDSDSADVHFKFPNDGKTMVPAHKAILGIDNSVFNAMFFGPMKEKNVVEIVDATVSAFKEFLQFFYLASVTLTMENIEEVVRLADKYDMPKCLDSCAIFLRDQLTNDNMIDGYQLAILMNNQPLIEFCEGKIEMFTKNNLKSGTFLRCDKAVLERILKFDRLNCKEYDLFIACIEWAKSSCRVNGLDENELANLKDQLGDCFYLIRFETMEMKEIAMILANKRHRHLFSQDEQAEFICMKLDGNFESETFMKTQRPKRTWVWNREAVLTCALEEYKWIHTYCQESTWFSVNVPLMLGEIISVGIYAIRISSRIFIVEHTDESNVICMMDICMNLTPIQNYIKVPRPIAIHPNKVYEIRFELPLDPAGIYEHCTHRKMVHQLNEDGDDEEEVIKITFHDRGDERGLVSCLYFNRI